MKQRLQKSWASFRSLPGWVQVWVGLILGPANLMPFFMLDTWTGQVAALATLFVIATNLPIMLYYAGMNRAMSLPHLVAWIPLEVALVLRLTGNVGPGSPGTAELALIWLLLVVNGISLIFDALDSWRWVRGERDTPRPTG